MKMLSVEISDFPATGLILDIGGGGEGVIGQLKKDQVIAVDISKRELVEAPDGPLLKIVMDGRDLKFLDGTFATTTVFFTFMYISPTDHEKVFSEIHRVLAPGGRLLIWDAIFPEQIGEKKDRALFMLKINLPDTVINTGYGVRYPENEQGIAHYLELAEKTGFEVSSQKQAENWFYLELKKID
jgi:SAM-dependent methyltransferase